MAEKVDLSVNGASETYSYAAFREPRPSLNCQLRWSRLYSSTVTESNFAIRVSKIVEDRPPQRHIHDVAETVQIRRGADDNAAGPQNPPDAFQHEVTRYWQVLDDLRKEYEVSNLAVKVARICTDSNESLSTPCRATYSRCGPGRSDHNAVIVP